MDIQKIISEIVSKISGKDDLIARFTKDPAALIKELTGLDVDAKQIEAIVKGVAAKLGIDAADILKEGKGFLDKIKGIFGK